MVIIILLLLLISLALLHFLYNDRCLIENLDSESDNTDDTEDTEDSSVQYQPYTDLSEDPINGPMFLAMKNAANISALHSQLSALKNVPSQISDLSGVANSNSKAIVNIGKEIHKVGEASFNTDISSGLYPSASSVINSQNSTSTSWLNTLDSNGVSSSDSQSGSFTSALFNSTSTPSTMSSTPSTTFLTDSTAIDSTAIDSTATDSTATDSTSNSKYSFDSIEAAGGW